MIHRRNDRNRDRRPNRYCTLMALSLTALVGWGLSLETPGPASAQQPAKLSEAEAALIVGNTWFQPSYGANGVNYRVVAAP